MNILFFASLRERFNTELYSVDLPSGSTVSDLFNVIENDLGNLPQNTICAINHNVSQPDEVIYESDEVALYPPVTGG